MRGATAAVRQCAGEARGSETQAAAAAAAAAAHSPAAASSTHNPQATGSGGSQLPAPRPTDQQQTSGQRGQWPVIGGAVWWRGLVGGSGVYAVLTTVGGCGAGHSGCAPQTNHQSTTNSN
jgi:hypothetical protein